jgi:neutral amino acid transport system ATP-binding protein
VMSDPAVIDAYLGAHHDTDLGEEEVSEEVLAEIAEEVAAEEAKREAETEAAPTEPDAGVEEKK